MRWQDRSAYGRHDCCVTTANEPGALRNFDIEMPFKYSTAGGVKEEARFGFAWQMMMLERMRAHRSAPPMSLSEYSVHCSISFGLSKLTMSANRSRRRLARYLCSTHSTGFARRVQCRSDHTEDVVRGCAAEKWTLTVSSSSSDRAIHIRDVVGGAVSGRQGGLICV